VTAVAVDGLSFDFPAKWSASKYDEWSFYRNQFGKMRGGIKAVDLVAIDPSETVWLIEVKDYRVHQRTKPIDLGAEVQHKVFDTLAALLPAKVNANDSTESGFARDVLRARKLRVVLHLEQPAKHSFFRPRAINPADIEEKLKVLLKPIDAHPIVAEKAEMRSLAWSVQ
jgi:hypothetical protein